MAAPRKRYTKDEFLESLIRNNGHLWAVVEELGICYSTVDKYIKDYKLGKIVKELYANRHKRMIAKAETGLEEALDQKKQWAISFVLQRLGKEKYSEKVINETTITENKVIKPKIKNSKKEITKKLKEDD